MSLEKVSVLVGSHQTRLIASQVKMVSGRLGLAVDMLKGLQVVGSS